jgi:hypothetical protein
MIPKLNPTAELVRIFAWDLIGVTIRANMTAKVTSPLFMTTSLFVLSLRQDFLCSQNG